MKIEVLGPGCPRCRTLAANAADAVSAAGVDCQVEKVTDITEIMKRGVMMTPVLVLDGEVKSSGKVLSVDEIKALITK